METIIDSKQVSIIGLAKMGRKLAQLYLEAGFKVTVWNRTAERTRELNDVIIAASAEAAMLDNLLSIICVQDNTVTLEIISSVQDKSRLKDKTIINLATGTPAEAEGLESLLINNGGHYLNGAIQAAPNQMGLPQTTILMGGKTEVFEKYKAYLEVLAGNLRHLSDKAAALPAMDMATLT